MDMAWSDHHLVPRSSDFSLSTLETIKAAWSSPSACVKANWCRIPAAILIAFGLMFLFTFFCCCAQCLSCCCCRRSRQAPRGFGESERGMGDQSLLPNSGSFGHSNLPSMPSYALGEYKKPTYAVIGDDGSVTTEDPEKRMREDFPNSVQDAASRPLFAQRTGVARPANDIFANANSSFHNQLNDDVDTSYDSAVPQYSAPDYQSTQISPSRRPLMPFDQESEYSQGPPPSFSSLPRTQQAAPLDQPTSYNTSRGQFNEGGPFPIIGRRPVNAARPLPNPSSSSSSAAAAAARPLPQHPETSYRRSNSPPPALSHDDWRGTPSTTTPYPVGSLREEESSRVLRDTYEFDPYGNNNNNNNSNNSSGGVGNAFHGSF